MVKRHSFQKKHGRGYRAVLAFPLLGLFLLVQVNLYHAITFTRKFQEQPPYNHQYTNNNNNNKNVLHFYYINLDQSIDRRVGLEQDFRALPPHLQSSVKLHRVPAHTTNELETMLANGTFVLNGVEGLSYENKRESKREYLYSEAACALSHLTAIHQAFVSGHEIAIIMEDDARLTPEFIQHLDEYAKLAPNDWNVLQWTTSNSRLNSKEPFQSNDFWVSWSPVFYGAIVYTLKRDTMKTILDKTVKDYSKDGRSVLSWEFQDPDVVVADELVYYLGQPTYTSTYRWIPLRNVETTMGSGHEVLNDLQFGQSSNQIQNLQNLQRTESIVVWTSLCITTTESIQQELQRLSADVETLAKFNPASHWHVHVLLANQEVQDAFQKIASQLTNNNIDFHTVMNPQCHFGKFERYKSLLPHLSEYDFVLWKDNHIRLSGLEWNTFLDKKKSSLVIGPYFETTEPVLYRSRFDRMDRKELLNFQDAIIFNFWTDKTFVPPDSYSTMYVDPGFALLNSHFASWYLTQILTNEFIHLNTNVGPEFMWCAAAMIYAKMHDQSNTPACSLIFVNALSEDTPTRQEEEDWQESRRQVLSFFSNNATLAKWIQASSLLIPNVMTLQEYAEWCFAAGDGDGSSDDVTRMTASECALYMAKKSAVEFARDFQMMQPMLEL